MKTYKVTVDTNGTIHWYNQQDQLHNEHGPAIECADGTKRWYLNGERHREDGPAIKWADGSKSWYRNGERHREDGPAIEWTDGYKVWYLNNNWLTEQQFLEQTRSCEGKVVEIDGKKYKLSSI